MKENNKVFFVLLGLPVLLIILIGLFLFLSKEYSFNKTEKVEEKSSLVLDSYLSDILYEENNNFVLGSRNNLVRIVGFSDFACVYCKSASKVVRELFLKYPNKVKLVFRDYPLHTDNLISLKAALASRCANEQNKFLEMHDRLFLSDQQFDDNKITKYATQIGLNMDQFNNCIRSEKYIPNIQKDLKAGINLQVNGTPVFFINGIKAEGVFTVEQFENIIINKLGIKL